MVRLRSEVGRPRLLGPFDSFLVLRGIKTLAVRMERHERSGRAVAAFLDGHDKVTRVLYPGLADHPGRELHQRQASGFGALISCSTSAATSVPRSSSAACA